MYPDKIKLVYKNFPLDDDGPSMLAALAATAAHRQDRFWEFHEELFNGADRLDDAMMIEIATQLGMNVVQFEDELEDPATFERVEGDILIGDEAGVDRVPSVFINGRPVKNGSLDRVVELVERELGNGAGRDAAAD